MGGRRQRERGPSVAVLTPEEQLFDGGPKTEDRGDAALRKTHARETATHS